MAYCVSKNWAMLESKVGAIRRMLEDFPLEISQRLICLVGSMGTRVVMQEQQWEGRTFFRSSLSLRPALAVVPHQAIAFVGPDCLQIHFSPKVTILLIKRWSFGN
jgi:hypothetical protein